MSLDRGQHRRWCAITDHEPAEPCASRAVEVGAASLWISQPPEGAPVVVWDIPAGTVLEVGAARALMESGLRLVAADSL